MKFGLACPHHAGHSPPRGRCEEQSGRQAREIELISPIDQQEDDVSELGDTHRRKEGPGQVAANRGKTLDGRND